MTHPTDLLSARARVNIVAALVTLAHGAKSHGDLSLETELLELAARIEAAAAVRIEAPAVEVAR